MRAGRLDRLITIQRKTDTQDEWGQPIPAWVDVKHREPASRTPLEGAERFGGDQWVASQQVEFIIRWHAAVASLHPQDRIIDPAPDSSNVQAPTFTEIYEIMAVDEIGRREGLRIKAARRPDVT